MKEEALQTHAMAIFQAALRAADPALAVRKHWDIQPEQYRNIYVVGAGKAGAAMAAEAERKLGSRITKGFLNVKYDHTTPLRHIELNEAGHPVPDENGRRGAQTILDIVSEAGEGDLVICLLSGGASALLPLPVPGLSLEHKQEITKQLLAAGANIHEMNAIRKHLSSIKGGQLAQKAAPAKVKSFILSDVIGDDLDVIGSGPTALDRSTVADARKLLHRFGVLGNTEKYLQETPKTVEAENIVVGSNRQALQVCHAESKKPWVPNSAIGHHDPRRNRRCGTDARSHCTGNSGIRQPHSAACLHHLRRGNHRAL